MDAWAMPYRGNKDITWYNPSDFNGVLFLLREPHRTQNEATAEEVIKGNFEWLSHVIGRHPSVAADQCLCRDHQTSIYGNRLYEMLDSISNSKCDLRSIAYANINTSGGGASCSPEGKSIIHDPIELRATLNRIFSYIPEDRTVCIITCRDIFIQLVSKDSIRDNTGFIYSNNTVSRTGKYNEITLIEMIKHPCISPRICGSHISLL